jgi:predicted cobalt transporter CbtA
VDGNVGQSYPCELSEHHAGPDASASVPASVKRRDAWEEANQGWEKLAVFADPFEEIKP